MTNYSSDNILMMIMILKIIMIPMIIMLINNDNNKVHILRTIPGIISILHDTHASGW